MNQIINLSRRDLLRTGALVGGGLILGMFIPGPRSSRADVDEAPPPSFEPNAFLRILPDESVTVIIGHSEMGQGTYTGLSMLVAEELDADWTKVHAESAPVAPAHNHTAYGIQMTGGSSSTWSEWDRMRKAGAAARMMLVNAAAALWLVDPRTCRAENGQVFHDGSKRSLSYGKLVDRASKLNTPKNVALKDPKDYKLIGKPIKRLDTPDKTDGKAQFGLDVTVPGMLYAVVARSPVFGGKVKSFNSDKAQAMPGVRHAVQIERGVAIVADGFWNAKQAREALQIEWDEGPLASLDSKTQGEQYAQLAQKPGAVARKEGDATRALAGAAKKLEAVYELPYLAHATMEPLNCVADVREASCEVWTGTQFQTVDLNAAAKDAGLKPEQVKIHTMLLGGGFGRRAVPDSHFVREAVQISKAVKTPVKVIWTREDDIRGGYYRPRAYHSLSGALDDGGNLLAWQQRIVCQSFIMGTPFEGFIIKDGVDETAVEGAKDTPYEIPNLLVDWQMAPGGVPTLWWRSVGHSHSAFAVESFIDELAHAAGKDPVEFRRAMLGNHPRHRGVLELAAEKAGWGQPLSKGLARGVAVHESFGSFIANVAEVSVSEKGKIKVHRVVCAIDCGQVVNPDTVRAQMEGAIVFGLSAALYGEITFENGRVRQGNFHDYPVLRINEMPQVEVYIVYSQEKLGGVGEPGVPCIAPAMANAVFTLTGKRVRHLPIRAADLVTA